MGLALLGDPEDHFGVVALPMDPAENLFSRAPNREAATAARPLGQRLIGALGRKLMLAPGAEAEVTFLVVWHFPGLLRASLGGLQDLDKLKRAYAARFASAAAVARHVADNFPTLAGQTRLWNRTWYDSTLPYWLLGPDLHSHLHPGHQHLLPLR